ncbi:DUF2004 domain-containing protein [Sinomonas sp. ASV322]|uniref:DUF2004 domain-containing protein n=1 Tax=Sinomonas sp. ASV322 TaxID=3041920 RepID=UPI0027DDBED3|nr:DUF2004 domain-containing protein [Sinomonas sp. ASV322]MDQ4504589.1 DUF2004 domain-containing protein [Sinomonas sp. ASV322]
METAVSRHFGEIALTPAGQRIISGRYEHDGVPIDLDLSIGEHERLDEAEVHKVDYRLRFLPELIEAARERIAQDLEDEDSSVVEYRHFHCQNLEDGKIRELFGVERSDEVDDDHFVRALRLSRVGIFPGQPERYFVLDFTLGQGFTDEVLVAAADEDGVVDDEVNWD